MYINLEKLPSDIGALHDIIISLYAEHNIFLERNKFLEEKAKAQTQEILELNGQLILLRAKLYGKSSEKLSKQKKDEIQEEIENLELKLDSITEANATTGVYSIDTSIGQAKRQKLPEHLPREDVVLNPEPKCPECGGEDFEKISDDISESLDYIPAKLKVIRTIRPRCKCKNCQQIVQAYPASKPIDKGNAEAGLLAQILVQKYCYHLPLYRQGQLFAYEGVLLAASTLCGWVSACAKLLEPLSQKIKDSVFASDYIHGDDTVVKVLEPGLGKTKTGRVWAYVSDGRPHGSLEPVAACYYYSPDRKATHPEKHLKNYSGVMHADAYAGYNGLYIDGKNDGTSITEAACWAHTRRKFYEVTVASSNATIANQTLEQIGKIYAIEEEIRGSPSEERYKVRQARTKVLVEELFAFWQKAQQQLSKKSRTAKAIQYAFNNKAALIRFLEDGKIEVDNNAAERALRVIAVGRKNWIFAGSDQGGENAAVIYTILETAKLNGVNPWRYLKQVLGAIQDYNSNKLEDLLPWNLVLTDTT